MGIEYWRSYRSLFKIEVNENKHIYIVLLYYCTFNTESNNIPIGWPSTLDPSGHFFNYSYAHIYGVDTEEYLL